MTEGHSTAAPPPLSISVPDDDSSVQSLTTNHQNPDDTSAGSSPSTAVTAQSLVGSPISTNSPRASLKRSLTEDDANSQMSSGMHREPNITPASSGLSAAVTIQSPMSSGLSNVVQPSPFATNHSADAPAAGPSAQPVSSSDKPPTKRRKLTTQEKEQEKAAKTAQKAQREAEIAEKRKQAAELKAQKEEEKRMKAEEKRLKDEGKRRLTEEAAVKKKEEQDKKNRVSSSPRHISWTVFPPLPNISSYFSHPTFFLNL
jgi:hypothetical protein